MAAIFFTDNSTIQRLHQEFYTLRCPFVNWANNETGLKGTLKLIKNN